MSMTRRKPVACVLLALAVALVQPWALAQEKNPAPPAPSPLGGEGKGEGNQVELKKGDHILFYGDSLTDQARGPKGWVTIVREALKEKHPDLGLEVTTFAIGGYCIVDRVKRVDQEVLAKKPTIVVIQGGVPDALRYKRDQFKTGLEELIERLQKAGVRVVVCSCTSLGEKHDGSNRIDKNLDEFADVARQVARDKKLPLNDLRKAFKEYWIKHNPDNKASGILTNDGNHFNDIGNKFVAAQMLKMFK
jgi:lysophospholipase L1-like esterase